MKPLEEMTREEMQAEILRQMTPLEIVAPFFGMDQPWTKEEKEELARVMETAMKEIYGEESLQPNAKRS
jgi:hypothetical protein